MRAALALSLTLLVAASATAAVTRSFRQTTAKDFEEGEATASMVLPTGDVVPGMKSTAITLDAAFVWCGALSPDGKVAYFGTGDQGRVYAVDTSATGGKARLVTTLEAAWVTALAVRHDGTLIAGTTPGGRVYTIDPKSGKSKVLATLTAEHVWALALDAKSGTVYAGTGGPGKIAAIDAGGRARAIWDSGDKHVVSLLTADDKHLYAGTSEEAILYKVGLDGRAEAIADFDAEEVRALARSGNSLYAAVNDFEKSGGGLAGPAAAAPRGTKITTASSGSPASAGSLPRPGQRKAKAALYRIDADGRMEQMFSIPDGYFTAVAFDDGGRAYVGTGSEGRVYRVAPDRTAALAIDVSERQVLALLKAGNGFLVGTGDVGGIYRAVAAAPKQATYLSRVLDGEYRSRWGLFRWHGTHDVAIESRSGNTAKPDVTWTGFAPLERSHPTAEGGAGQIASPPARYVQYRATFGAPEGRLSAVTLAYLPQNQRARITDLGVAESGGGAPALGALGALAASTPAASAPRVHQTVLKLRWKVENPDGDELNYRLAFRAESDAVWRPLGGPEPITKTDYDWNTEGLPDGTYVVKLTASDDRSEPRERALDTTFTSAPILVDNRKPEVLGLAVKYPHLSGRARDDQSPLSSLEYAIDGGDWQILSPADGICDDLVESFTITLPTLAPGPHAVTVRAWDSADNVGAAALTVRAPGK